MFKTWLHQCKKTLLNLWSNLKQALQKLWGNLKSLLNKALTSLYKGLQNLKSILKSLYSKR
jgi:hypothetical protein